MKLVKEHINEKFEEQSDPIKDMGIGLEKYKKPQNNINDFFNLVDEYMLELKQIKNWNKLRDDDYFDYIKICGNEMRSPFDVGNKIFRDLKRRKLLGVNEKFKEDSDPIHDMNIGVIRKINDWLEYYLELRKPTMSSDMFTINDDLTIDVDMDLDLSYYFFKTLPPYIKFNHVKGRFACCFNHNSPIRINGPNTVDHDYIVYYSYPLLVNENIIRKYCDVKGNVHFYRE